MLPEGYQEKFTLEKFLNLEREYRLKWKALSDEYEANYNAIKEDKE